MTESNSISESVRLEEGRPSGPTIRKGKSNQVVGTPRAFLDAVEDRFGFIEWDLAATAENNVVRRMPNRYFGPDRTEEKLRDALANDWNFDDITTWCNPPFANIAPWAAKLATVRDRVGWTLMLVPASVGSSWFAEHVHGKACALFLSPRLTFVGSPDPYPRDLMLVASGYGLHGTQTWRWK